MRNTPIRNRKFPKNSESPKNIIFCSHQIEQIEEMLTKLICKLDESFGKPELLKQQKNFVHDAGDKVIELDDNESEATSDVTGEAKSIRQFEFFLNETHFHLDQLYKKLEGIVGSITNDDLELMLQNGTLAADDNRVRLFVLSLSSFNQKFLKLLNQQASDEVRQHKPSNDSDCFIDPAIDPLEPLEQLHQDLYDYLQSQDAQHIQSLKSVPLDNNGSFIVSHMFSPITRRGSFSSGRTTPSSDRTTLSPTVPINDSNTFNIDGINTLNTMFSHVVNGNSYDSDDVNNLTDNENGDELPFAMDPLEEINITTLKKS